MNGCVLLLYKTGFFIDSVVANAIWDFKVISSRYKIFFSRKEVCRGSYEIVKQINIKCQFAVL